MTALILDEHDRQALLDVVHEFAEAELRPLVLHPETPADASSVSAALDGLTGLGVLPSTASDLGDAEGLSLWYSPDDVTSCRLTLDLLRALAHVAPGVAVLAHLRGLATWLDHEAGTAGEQVHVALGAAVPGGARAMGASLGAPSVAPGPDERGVLLAAWGTPTTGRRLAIGPEAWSDLWWPAWDPAAGWGLRRTPRASLVVDQQRAHGLDELACQAWHLREGDDPEGDDSEGAERLGHTVVVHALAAHALGLLAIATATAERTLARARAYAGLRRQGGSLISRHDAVAGLLTRAEHAVWTAHAGVDRAAAASGGVERLHQAWRASAQLLPLLCAAGNDSLQVLGGIGYMRDIGAERDQRDLNSLRLMGGSPHDLTLRCAALDDTATGRES